MEIFSIIFILLISNINQSLTGNATDVLFCYIEMTKVNNSHRINFRYDKVMKGVKLFNSLIDYHKMIMSISLNKLMHALNGNIIAEETDIIEFLETWDCKKSFFCSETEPTKIVASFKNCPREFIRFLETGEIDSSLKRFKYPLNIIKYNKVVDYRPHISQPNEVGISNRSQNKQTYSLIQQSKEMVDSIQKTDQDLLEIRKEISAFMKVLDEKRELINVDFTRAFNELSLLKKTADSSVLELDESLKELRKIRANDQLRNENLKLYEWNKTIIQAFRHDFIRPLPSLSPHNLMETFRGIDFTDTTLDQDWYEAKEYLLWDTVKKIQEVENDFNNKFKRLESENTVMREEIYKLTKTRLPEPIVQTPIIEKSYEISKRKNEEIEEEEKHERMKIMLEEKLRLIELQNKKEVIQQLEDSQNRLMLKSRELTSTNIDPIEIMSPEVREQLKEAKSRLLLKKTEKDTEKETVVKKPSEQTTVQDDQPKKSLEPETNQTINIDLSKPKDKDPGTKQKTKITTIEFNPDLIPTFNRAKPTGGKIVNLGPNTANALKCWRPKIDNLAPLIDFVVNGNSEANISDDHKKIANFLKVAKFNHNFGKLEVEYSDESRRMVQVFQA